MMSSSDESKFLWLYITFAALALASQSAVAEYRDVPDIKPFGLLDVSGHVRAGYLFDDRERNSPAANSAEDRSTWEEEIFILTESFVYHPGFLNMELGGGPLFVQQEFGSDARDDSYNDTFFNYLANFNFLELKTYPFSLYYERSHPSVTRNLAGRFLTRNDSYGIKGRVFDLLGGSTSINYDVGRFDSDGSALGWVVDEQTDRAQVVLETAYRAKDSLQIKYDRFDTDSASGSPTLPIDASNTTQDIVEIQSRNNFGVDGQVRLLQVLRRLDQDTRTTTRAELEDWHYLADVRWEHSESSRSFFRYRHNESDRTTSKADSATAALGFAREATEELQYDMAAEYESVDQTGFERDQYGGRAGASFRRDTGFGSWGMAATARAARVDQSSSAAQIQIFDEQIVLAGTTPSRLANEFVVPGSVLVSNVTRSQVYVEDLDYRLVVTGGVTSIQRLVGGRINDGELVLVDYEYQSSGTAEYDSLESGVSTSFAIHDYMHVYIRYDVLDTNVRSGMLTNPINDRNNLELGVGINNKFLDGWTLSGQYRHIDRDEEISPFVTDAVDISITTSLRGIVKLTLAGSLNETDYDNSTEDVSLVTYRAGLSGRVFGRIQFNYDAAYLDDDGGALSRRQLQHRLNFQWGYRRMRLSLRAQYSDEKLGTTDVLNNFVTMQITRAF